MPSSISKLLETNINTAISKRKINHTGGLPEKIILIKNEQYDLISNIDVEDGLINGTQCTIKFIQVTQKNKLLPYVVWVEFENTHIATNYRKKYSYLYTHHKINQQWIPIIKIKRSFIVKDHWIHRIQFPLRQAAACTIHVSQSSTYPEIYVDLQTFTKPPAIFWEHMHYAAFSRVTSISGLYVENINESNISISKKVTNYLANALENNKLETNITFKDENTFNILLNNARSFKKHFKTIKENEIIQQQHINIFLESKLSKYDTSFTYRIKDFIIVRADEKNTMNTHYGIISYVDKIITILEIQSMSTEQFDTLYLNTIFKNKNISIFAIYSSPKNSYQQIQKHLIPVIHNEYSCNKDIILIGDFNIPYNSPIYMKLCADLLKYNL